MTVFLRHIKICRHGLDSLSVPVNPTNGVSEQPLVSLVDGPVFISVLVGSGVAPRRRSACGRELVFGRNGRCLRAFAQEARATTQWRRETQPGSCKEILSKSVQRGRLLTRIRPVMPFCQRRRPVWGAIPFRGGSGALIPHRRNMTSYRVDRERYGRTGKRRAV